MVKPEPDDDGDVPIKDEPDDDDDTPMDEIPEPPPVADAATGEFPDGSDNSGMHPTPTTYTKTLIVESATQGEEFATPTAQSYHKSVDLAAVQLYNEQISEELEFNDGTETWSNYTHDGDYTTTTWSSGNPRKHMWVEGFQVRYSWDWTSSLTKNYYPNITPTWVYASSGKAMYYWFDVIFNDWQAFHGYANYARSKDGLPSLNWPGMVKCKHSFFGGVQRPRQRGTYEDWFTQSFDDGINYCAPHIRDVSLLPSTPLPKRRRIVDITGRTTRDEDQIFETGPQQPIDPTRTPTYNGTTGPQFATGNVTTFGDGLSSWSTNLNLTPPDRNRPYMKICDRVWTEPGLTNFQPNTTNLADSQLKNPDSLIGWDQNFNSWCGNYQTYKFMSYTERPVTLYSGWTRPGSNTQMVGFTAGQYLVATGYGVTSIAPGASINGSSSYRLRTSSVQSELLSVMPTGPSNFFGFIYDYSVGEFGEAKWISQL